MGYTTRTGTQIQDYQPDDDDDTMYINSELGGETLADIMERIQEKWPGESMENIRMSSELIHTHYLGYDLYDRCDWTDFIIIRRVVKT
jgi:hypothetical protein